MVSNSFNRAGLLGGRAVQQVGFGQAIEPDRAALALVVTDVSDVHVRRPDGAGTMPMAMSSRSVTSAANSNTAAVTPLVRIANSLPSGPSLCAHRMPGCRRLAARPEISLSWPPTTSPSGILPQRHRTQAGRGQAVPHPARARAEGQGPPPGLATNLNRRAWSLPRDGGFVRGGTFRQLVCIGGCQCHPGEPGLSMIGLATPGPSTRSQTVFR